MGSINFKSGNTVVSKLRAGTLRCRFVCKESRLYLQPHNTCRLDSLTIFVLSHVLFAFVHRSQGTGVTSRFYGGICILAALMKIRHSCT